MQRLRRISNTVMGNPMGNIPESKDNANDTDARNPSEVSSNPASPDLASDAADILSPEGSLADADNVSENMSDTSQRRRRRSSVAEALHDVISAGRDMLRSNSKNSVDESKGDELGAVVVDNGSCAIGDAVKGPPRFKYSKQPKYVGFSSDI